MHRHILLFSLIWGCAEPVETTSVVESESAPLLPLYSIRIQAIATADDDGSNSSPVTATTISNLLPRLNEIYNSTRIQILFDPATDYVKRNSTFLNQRFTLLADPTDYHDKDVPPPTQKDWYDAARRVEADKYRDKLVIFFARPDELAFDKDLGHWKIERTSGGSSSRHARSVSWRGSPQAADLAHEMGHYLHQQHVQRGMDNLDEAADAIADYLADGHPVVAGLNALDNDLPWVLDTPPDAGGDIFVKANDTTDNDVDDGDKCGPVDSVEIPVGNHSYTLEPDRSLVMSYFKNCPFEQHFSPDQRTRIYEAATLMNRRNIFHYVPEPATSSTPILQYQATETAGSINEIKIARVGVNRVVTASLDVSTLKLIVWDIGTGSIDGQIMRRGEIVVGDINRSRAKSFAITHGGLRQALVAYRNPGGGLTLKSFAIDTAGNLSLSKTETAGAITDVELARIDPVTFVTPVRLESGVLRTIAWQIFANGEIHRRGHGDGGVIDEIEGVTPYTPDGINGEDIDGAATIFVKTGGNLGVQTWKLLGDSSVVLADSEPAGAITSSTASALDFDLAATVVQSTSNVQKVIAWRSNTGGYITRLGSYTAGSCTTTASAAIGTRYLATACRRPSDGVQVVRLYEVSTDGDVTLEHEQESGTALDLAMTDVGANKVVLASRGVGNRLVMKTFAVAP